MDPADALAVIRRLQPDLAERMQPIFDERPEAAAELIRERFPRAVGLVRLRSQDPEMFEVKAEHLSAATAVYDLARRLSAKDHDEPAMRAALDGPVRRATEARLAVRELELQRMAERLERERVQLADHRARHEARVSGFIDRVIGRVQRARPDAEARERGAERRGGEVRPTRSE
ncbi:MAG: hypothetical protein AAF288_07480 [Planctomycetota bacterium]